MPLPPRELHRGDATSVLFIWVSSLGKEQLDELHPGLRMGRRPLELSRSAETSLVTAISTHRPLVLRSGMSTTDAAALFEDWELRVSQDTTLYQMAGGKGQHTLETMWAAPLRLEHDLQTPRQSTRSLPGSRMHSPKVALRDGHGTYSDTLCA